MAFQETDQAGIRQQRGFFRAGAFPQSGDGPLFLSPGGQQGAREISEHRPQVGPDLAVKDMGFKGPPGQDFSAQPGPLFCFPGG